MRARWIHTLILITAFGCGDGADVEDPASDAAVAWETLLGQAATQVRDLGGDEATRKDAARLASRLEGLRSVAQAAQDLVDAPVPLPLEDHHRMVRRLERTAGRLVADARKIEATSSGFVPATTALVDLQARLQLLTKLFVERVGVGGPEVKARAMDLNRATFDDARIYHGSPDRFRKPAEVDLDQVYRHIPAYRKILAEKPDEDGPRYYFLLLTAGKTFRAALQAVSGREGWDLIGGLGAIRIPGQEIPRITERVVASLAD